MTEGLMSLNVLATTTFTWITFIVGFIWFTFVMFVVAIDSHVETELIEMKKRADKSDADMRKRMGL